VADTCWTPYPRDGGGRFCSAFDGTSGILGTPPQVGLLLLVRAQRQQAARRGSSSVRLRKVPTTDKDDWEADLDGSDESDELGDGVSYTLGYPMSHAGGSSSVSSRLSAVAAAKATAAAALEDDEAGLVVGEVSSRGRRTTAYLDSPESAVPVLPAPPGAQRRSQPPRWSEDDPAKAAQAALAKDRRERERKRLAADELEL